MNRCYVKTKRSELAAMTTNERLCVTGKMIEFENALANKDAKQVRLILHSVDVDEVSIDMIIRDMG